MSSTTSAPHGHCVNLHQLELTLDILTKVTRYLLHIEVPDEDGVVIADEVKQGSYDADNMELNYCNPLNWSQGS